MIKPVAVYVAYRLLRRIVTILIVATLAALLLSDTHDTAGHGSHALTTVQNAAHSLEQLLQQALREAIGP